jgi:hypothetical protein
MGNPEKVKDQTSEAAGKTAASSFTRIDESLIKQAKHKNHRRKHGQ